MPSPWISHGLYLETDMTQSNQLERVLRDGTREAGLRPTLYRELLRSEIFVLAVTPDGGKATIWNSKIVAWIRFDGAQVIPCFTTIKKARKAAEKHQFAYKVKAAQIMVSARLSGHTLPTTTLNRIQYG